MQEEGEAGAGACAEPGVDASVKGRLYVWAVPDAREPNLSGNDPAATAPTPAAAEGDARADEHDAAAHAHASAADAAAPTPGGGAHASLSLVPGLDVPAIVRALAATPVMNIALGDSHAVAVTGTKAASAAIRGSGLANTLRVICHVSGRERVLVGEQYERRAWARCRGSQSCSEDTAAGGGV